MTQSKGFPRRDEPADDPGPGAPPQPSRAGIVRDPAGDVSDRPQGDPEIPELGAHDDEREGV